MAAGMWKMKVVEPRVVITVGLAVGGLLLVFAACDPAKKRIELERQAEAIGNSFCYACHINFKFEADEIALVHEVVGIGCTGCHGESVAHRNDEDSINAVDVMFSAARINPFCMTCHSRDKIIERSVHRTALDGAAGEKKYCTDCHGKHRLGVRTRRWDKETGELIWDDGVHVEE